jgi:hypothetical protein
MSATTPCVRSAGWHGHQGNVEAEDVMESHIIRGGYPAAVFAGQVDIKLFSISKICGRRRSRPLG